MSLIMHTKLVLEVLSNAIRARNASPIISA